ncbi:biotin transporter BioY [Sporosarcina pasteurii]|uniref:Biotin transporter n=1 Tax=Sporosarcina pasteurii TaxID=1474 RepID=A0A380CKX5_SPOPA|nr:biotin transporter BioY [Sporosarcina pasteurii]MDS9471969.1 biotin transporter BioY [Sporosarcina pasteurii]QBQ06699.1 biotin transporter BioY [Sporosarcina pasteurii]SUJ21637.1 Biotin ECF transporter S component BioY [Sporosarcina pasteurii]
MTTVVEHRKGMDALSLVHCGMFAALMMIGANITAFVPFLVVGGVPITLQTFFAILAGLILGSRLGAISMTVYMFIGLAGAPVFSKFSGGFGAVVSPTFGFIVSFIFTAYIAGKIVEKNGKLQGYIIAALVAMTVNYLFGTNWMYFAYKLWAAAPDAFTYKVAWLWMLPPLPKDILLAVLAGIFGHRMFKILRVRR